MAQCLTPITLKDENKTVVPCGKCTTCTARRASHWSFRLLQEERFSSSAWFVTLTYNTEHVPYTKCGFKTVCKRDIQLFFKRLRKLHGKSKIKYYCAAEYGTKTFRPHYHIILFNANIDLVQPAWTINEKPIGEIHYGTVEGASVGYTLKYISKGKLIPQHQNDDRTPEFSLMSKGLAASMLPTLSKLGISPRSMNVFTASRSKELSFPCPDIINNLYTETSLRRFQLPLSNALRIRNTKTF